MNANDGGTCCAPFDNVGSALLYLFVSVYTFLGLAIICDDYFVESLEVISETLGLSEDVAGATFMAAGSSAPELFTAIVTVLITGGSEGLGAIVGSAVFNIMVIVGLTAVVACSGGAYLPSFFLFSFRYALDFYFTLSLSLQFGGTLLRETVWCTSLPLSSWWW